MENTPKQLQQQKLTNALLGIVIVILLFGLYTLYHCVCPARTDAVTPAEVVETTTPQAAVSTTTTSMIKPVVYNNVTIGLTFTYPAGYGPVTVNTHPCPTGTGTVIVGRVTTVNFVSTSVGCTDTTVPTGATGTTQLQTGPIINPDGTIKEPVQTTTSGTPITTNSGAVGIITKDPKFGTVITFPTKNPEYPQLVLWNDAGGSDATLMAIAKTIVLK